MTDDVWEYQVDWMDGSTTIKDAPCDASVSAALVFVTVHGILPPGPPPSPLVLRILKNGKVRTCYDFEQERFFQSDILHIAREDGCTWTPGKVTNASLDYLCADNKHATLVEACLASQLRGCRKLLQEIRDATTDRDLYDRIEKLLEGT